MRAILSTADPQFPLDDESLASTREGVDCETIGIWSIFVAVAALFGFLTSGALVAEHAITASTVSFGACLLANQSILVASEITLKDRAAAGCSMGATRLTVMHNGHTLGELSLAAMSKEAFTSNHLSSGASLLSIADVEMWKTVSRAIRTGEAVTWQLEGQVPVKVNTFGITFSKVPFRKEIALQKASSSQFHSFRGIALCTSSAPRLEATNHVPEQSGNGLNRIISNAMLKFSSALVLPRTQRTASISTPRTQQAASIATTGSFLQSSPSASAQGIPFELDSRTLETAEAYDITSKPSNQIANNMVASSSGTSLKIGGLVFGTSAILSLLLLHLTLGIGSRFSLLRSVAATMSTAATLLGRLGSDTPASAETALI